MLESKAYCGMDILNMTTKNFLRLLVEKGKIDILRECFTVGNGTSSMSQNMSNIYDRELLNVLDEDVFDDILEDEEYLKKCMLRFTLPEQLVGRVIERYYDNSVIIKLLIASSLELFTAPQVLRLSENKRYLSDIIPKSAKLSPEAAYVLRGKNLIKIFASEHLGYFVKTQNKGLKIWDLSGDAITVRLKALDITDEEMQWGMQHIRDISDDFYKIGKLKFQMIGAKLPTEYIDEIIKTWDYDISDEFIGYMFQKQDVSMVINYIMDRFDVKDGLIVKLLSNQHVSLEHKKRFYIDKMELILKNKPDRIPILDCHIF